VIATLFTRRLRTRDLRLIDRYGIGLVIVATATVLHHLTSLFSDQAPYFLFFLAVIVCGLFFGWTTGILVVNLSTVALSFFFLEPVGSLNITSESDRWHLLVFFFLGVAAVSAMEGIFLLSGDQSADHEDE
jgi:K+-sensing histidine kinase KdpD